MNWSIPCRASAACAIATAVTSAAGGHAKNGDTHISGEGVEHQPRGVLKHMRMYRVAALTLSAVAVFGAAACAPKNNNGAPTTSPSASSTAAPSTTSTGAQFDIGNTINYVSTGTTTTLDCGNGKSLNVGGFNNTLTVKGTCGTVSIGGGDNKVTVDKIDRHLNVVGSHNAITYRDGDPKVENLGSGNTVNKGG